MTYFNHKIILNIATKLRKYNMNCSTDFYLSQAAGYAIDAVCLSRITAKVISQFHLNLMI